MRFTIRDVLWLTVVAALVVALVLQQFRLQQAKASVSRSGYRLERLITFLRDGGYRVMWEDETGTSGFVCTEPYLRRASDGLIVDPGPLPKINLPHSENSN